MDKFPNIIDDVNLNQLGIKGGAKLRNYSAKKGDIDVLYRGLVPAAVKFINDHTVIVGCVAWLTHRRIFGALRQKSAVSFIVQKEDFLRPDKQGGTQSWKDFLRRQYTSLPGYLDRSDMPPPLNYRIGAAEGESDLIEGVRCVGIAVPKRGKNANGPKMHNKFMVGCEPHKSGKLLPKAVWTGSFNFTKNSSNSLENVLVIRDPSIAGPYLMEWAQICAISEPLDWKHTYVAPQHRYKG